MKTNHQSNLKRVQKCIQMFDRTLEKVVKIGKHRWSFRIEISATKYVETYQKPMRIQRDFYIDDWSPNAQ